MIAFIRSLYSFLFMLALPLILLRVWYRGLKLPEYRNRIKERFGHVAFEVQGPLWLHAVSVGEAISAVPLVRQFLKEHPDACVMMTTMTPTGSARVTDLFQKELNTRVFHCYIPYDHPRFIKRLIRKVNPRVFVGMETEIWPNLIHQLNLHQVPMVIANGRLSNHSFKWYKRIKGLMGQVLSPVSLVAAQSQLDAERFKAIGVKETHLSAIGNIKFDFDYQVNHEQARAIAERIDGPILTAGSTHEGEEKLVLKAFETLKRSIPDLTLILVPRHPDRFDGVYELCAKSFNTQRRTQGLPNGCDVYLGDTMGELMTMYAVSTISFVGGSLVPIGGHNLLEPASTSKAVVTGKHMHNFVRVTELLANSQAVEVVNNEDELVEAVIHLLDNASKRESMGAKAKQVVEQNKGALGRLLKAIESLWAQRRLAFE